jgi:hypothetical protein
MATVYLKDSNGHVFSTSHPEYHEDCERLTVAAGKASVIEQTKAKLRKVFPVGSLVQTQLLSVSASGMSRRISVLACVDGRVCRMDRDVALVIGYSVHDDGGIKVSGCGMDMGFSIAYSLGRALYPEGFGITGKGPHTTRGAGKLMRPKSPSQAKKMVKDGVEFYGRNGDASGWDNDGGYALTHQWL